MDDLRSVNMVTVDLQDTSISPMFVSSLQGLGKFLWMAIKIPQSFSNSIKWDSLLTLVPQAHDIMMWLLKYSALSLSNHPGGRTRPRVS